MAAEATPGAFSMASEAPNAETIPVSKMAFYTPEGTALEVTEDEMKQAMKYQRSQGYEK